MHDHPIWALIFLKTFYLEPVIAAIVGAAETAFQISCCVFVKPIFATVGVREFSIVTARGKQNTNCIRTKKTFNLLKKHGFAWRAMKCATEPILGTFMITDRIFYYHNGCYIFLRSLGFALGLCIRDKMKYTICSRTLFFWDLGQS